MDKRRSAVSHRTTKNAAIEEIHNLANGENPSSWGWVFEPPQYAWMTAFHVPFSYNASKNRRWSNNGRGAVFLSREVRQHQDQIIQMTREALRGVTIRQNKVWLSFFVEKPDHRGDAINVVDTLCDAIKQAIDLDDRWFCIDRVDWRVTKTDPSIFIKIGQESLTDIIVCSHCGGLKELDEFTNKKSQPLGKDRVCKKCKSILDVFSKRKRRQIVEQAGDRS